MDNMHIVDTYAQKLPVDLFGMARALGIRVMTQSLPSSGTMTRVGKQWIVLINSQDSMQRQRFTLAHMIAHYLLHRDLMDKGVHVDHLYDGTPNPSAPLTPAQDLQATRMAANLVMPIPALRQHKNLPLPDLAALFGVSEKAISIRLQSLQLTVQA